MKKRFALLLVLVLMVSLSACNSQNVKMQELIDANQITKLLETYDSVYVYRTRNGEFSGAYYLTDTHAFQKHETWSMYLTDGMGYACVDGVYQRVVYLTKNGLVSYQKYFADHYQSIVMDQSALWEGIDSVTEADGKTTVKSSMKEEDAEGFLGDAVARSFAGEHLLNSEDYSLITSKNLLTYDDGTTIEVVTKCTYDVEMPEEMKTLLAYEKQTENLRTITVVFHVGTEKEKVEHIQAPKGMIISLALPNGAADADYFSIYADAACTVPYQSNGDYVSDITVYIN